MFKEEVTEAVMRFFATGHMPGGGNDTSIVIIPKIENPFELKDCHPIDLCNVLYKVVSKCLVNRLRHIEGILYRKPKCFCSGKDDHGQLLAFECMHFMEHGTTVNSLFCSYKHCYKTQWAITKNEKKSQHEEIIRT
jgi:hypothetical protein